MSFYSKKMPYRVTLNTETNLFVVYDAANNNLKGTGVTIEKAIQELKKSA